MNQNQQIETVQLELIRPGPSHGQLLSPLTPYLALCGDESPVTLRIAVEHWRLLNRLERLRYVVRGRVGMVAVPDSSRESEVEGLGRDVGEIFSGIPTLGRELGRAAGHGSGLVHLELLISGSELSLLPYELMVAPVGYPGAGRPLLLQPQTPLVITRKVRRGQHELPVTWNRVPRILFVSAAPEGMSVPLRDHLQVLRGVLEPWIKWVEDPKERLAEVRKHLTVLNNASIDAIKRECAEHTYTHVHILAHGGSYEESGQTRYGLVLCNAADPARKQVVDGETLAEALHVKLKNATGYSRPSVVSLATCDAGNVGSVVAPGSSIAHDLHVHDVPWVFASQFPLTKRGSVYFAEQLYEGLVWGEDPRHLLARLRRSLYVTRGSDHDWGSLICYASTPVGLARDIELFRSRQYQRAIDNDRGRADFHQELMSKARDNGNAEEERHQEECFDTALRSARARVQRWKGQLPSGDDDAAREARVECFGVEGATEKKLAEQYHNAEREQDASNALGSSLAAYHDALRAKPDDHWVSTQYLCLTAILDRGADPDRWASTRGIAQAKLETEKGLDKAWAHGTLAELELLCVYHAPGMRSEEEVVSEIQRHCDKIIELVGWGDFAVLSTRRQFLRYVDWWWKDRKEAAVAAEAVTRLTRSSA